MSNTQPGFAPYFPHAPFGPVQFGEPYALGNPNDLGAAEQSFLVTTNPMYLALGGAVLFGGIGGVMGAQKDVKTAAIAGGGAAVVGALLGYFTPNLIAKMSGT
jgi:hypothetical protein